MDNENKVSVNDTDKVTRLGNRIFQAKTDWILKKRLADWGEKFVFLPFRFLKVTYNGLHVILRNEMKVK